MNYKNSPNHSLQFTMQLTEWFGELKKLTEWFGELKKFTETKLQLTEQFGELKKIDRKDNSRKHNRRKQKDTNLGQKIVVGDIIFNPKKF